MAKTVIKAKNVVRFKDGPAKPTAPAAEESSALKQVDEAIEQIEEAAARLDEAESKGEVVETEPLNLRKSKYLDEEPQDPDWADEDFDELDDGEEEDPDGVSTFAEVFIPLHTDSVATVIRKGMVIVSVIVILCCLVAIFMKRGAIGGTIPPDFSVWADYAANAAAVLRFDL